MAPELLAALDDLLGPGGVRTGGAIPARNTIDASAMAPCAPEALVLPRTTQEVSGILALCALHKQPVVVQGGMTGLVGGAVPARGEIALSLERMVGIEEIDSVCATMTVLAGTPLQTIHDAAKATGLLYGVDLGSRGSCTIGGNVATNAGGNQVLRFGMTRRNVLGLEAVLADGRIVSSGNKMLKNNTGYDWTQLMIGAEGTLGVITRVTLALHQRIDEIGSALLRLPSTQASIALLRRLESDLPRGLLAFEAVWGEMYDLATGRMGLRAPLPPGGDLYVLVETPAREGLDAMEEALCAAIADGLVLDAVLARSEADRLSFWALRESVYDHRKFFGPGIGFDVSVPLTHLPALIGDLREGIPRRFPNAIWVAFGHLGDSNIHASVIPQSPGEARDAVEGFFYEILARHEGSVSAEHGIGHLKKKYLPLSRTPAEIALMSQIKAALDPDRILNPGRIL